MSKILPLSEVKAKLSALIDEVASTHERVTVTRNGRPVAVIVSSDDLDTADETLEILSDPVTMGEIERGRLAIAEGDVATHEELLALRTTLRAKVT